VPQRGDGAGSEGFEDEDGFVGDGVVEAFGPGGRDVGGGEYEEVLDGGGDEKDAYVGWWDFGGILMAWTAWLGVVDLNVVLRSLFSNLLLCYILQSFSHGEQ
jgi:hypothetical protein